MRRLAARWWAGAAIVVAVLAAGGGAARAQADSPDLEQQLADKFAPIVMLKEQEAPCDADGEPYAPTSVEIVLGNPEVLLRQVGNGDPVVAVGPTADDLFELNEGFYLDFPGRALRPGCLYEQDFDKYSGTTTGDRDVVVYAHIATQPDRPDQLALQYWFYWYYNDWNNKHESDWEGIQLLFDVGTVAEALVTTPVSVGYAQHEGGERADWDSSKLTLEGDHPVVYPSAGSHASYFGSALYIGRSASEGFGCDTTDGPSVRYESQAIVLPDAVSDPTSDFAWLAFDGRWGERLAGPYNGPTGPQDKDRWTHPIDWQEGLRSGSVVVPAGDSQGDAVVNSFCTVIDAGSGALITVSHSPELLLVVVVLIFLLVRWLARRTSWSEVSTVPLVQRRRAGEIIRAAADAYRHQPAVLVTIGLVYLPAAILVGVTAWLLRFVPLVDSVIDLGEHAADTNLVLALLAGSGANLLAFVGVNAAVAASYDLQRAGETNVSGLAALRHAGSRAGDLFVGFLCWFVLIGALTVTVIGIPLAIWLVVRFQFVAQAVMLDQCRGVAGLRRSAELVRGRWWHTAVFVALSAGLGGLAVFVVGLLLLVVASGLPLWLFSALISLVYALVVPLTAMAMTLLYGDAVAQSSEVAGAPRQSAQALATSGAGG